MGITFLLLNVVANARKTKYESAITNNDRDNLQSLTTKLKEQWNQRRKLITGLRKTLAESVMIGSEGLTYSHKIQQGISPNEADIAMVSTDNWGNYGELNSFVLTQYGYSNKDMPRDTDLSKGFHLLEDKQRKPILFVVTVGTPDGTLNALESNLKRAVSKTTQQLIGKTVWLPLMGTGEGGLTLEDSYTTTIRTLNSLDGKLDGVDFMISIAPDKRGDLFMESFDQERIVNAFKKYKGSFFLAGSFWSGDEQAQRFFDESIWENGHEEKFFDVVNSTNVGDIIFLKSTYSEKSKSYLRIKGVGQVTENPNTGSELTVDWKIRGIEVNIEQLGKYRKTYARVMPNDLETILIAVGQRKIIEAGLIDLVEEVAKGKSTYADLIADSVSGDDHLDIGKDVLAFSRVIAATTFQPPLAIALFGKWGSGKSFFMNKLQDKIEELALFGKDSPYCQGIAQIHFNAWSYLDANLWAGMVTRIFEGLGDYISNDTRAKQSKKEIEKELSQQLNVTKKGMNLLEKQRQAVEDQITKFEEQKKSLKEKLGADIKAIKEKSFQNIITNVDKQFNIDQKITNALESNDSYVSTREQLKKIIPEKYWNKPSSIYDQIQSKYTFLKEFFRRDKLGWNLFWFCVILVTIFVVPALLVAFTDFLKDVSFLIPQAGLSFLVTVGAIWKRAETTYKELQPLIASFWNIKTDYETQVKEALFKNEQEEKALRLQIEQAKGQLEVVNDQIQQANFTKNDLDFRINNSLATEALYAFIKKRAASEDYQKYLGIVSLIRKDFEILSSLFLEHNEENQKSKEFREKFEKPLQRIILYIDDLDRCPEGRVVEVLEAVNLLMAFPLFVVVVGVDPRWVKNALLKKYHLQFTGQINGHKISKELNVIAAANYLEKIFQVPFHLKEASDDSVKYMLKTLSQPKEDLTDSNEDETFYEKKQTSGQSQSTTDKNIPFAGDTKTTIVVSKEKHTHLPESLVLTQKEVELMQDLSLVIGNNPRAVKRFVNVYQIARAHEELIYDNTQEEREFLVLMFLLALPIGPYQKLTPAFKEFITNQDNQHKKLSTFLAPQHKLERLDNLKRQLDIVLTDKQSFRILQEEVISSFNRHNLFIQRFTFEDCR